MYLCANLRFINIAHAARKAQLQPQPRARRALFSNVKAAIPLSPDVLESPNGISREGIRAAGCACCATGFDTFGQGYIYYLEPGFHGIPTESSILLGTIVFTSCSWYHKSMIQQNSNNRN